MSKAILVTAFCIATLLLLSPPPYAVALPPPNAAPVGTHHTLLKDEEIKNHNVEENCRDGDEECLMRRTLAAHLDYIYTQSKKP